MVSITCNHDISDLAETCFGVSLLTYAKVMAELLNSRAAVVSLSRITLSPFLGLVYILV